MLVVRVDSELHADDVPTPLTDWQNYGGLTRDESWATVAIAGTGIEPAILPTARNVDVVPTLLHLLEQPYDPASLDGRVLPGLQLD